MASGLVETAEELLAALGLTATTPLPLQVVQVKRRPSSLPVPSQAVHLAYGAVMRFWPLPPQTEHADEGLGQPKGSTPFP